MEGICHVRTVAKDRGTVHECLLSGGRFTAYFEWGFQFEEDRLLHEYFLAFVTESFDLAFEEVDLLGDLGVSHGEQFFDDVVDVYFNLTLHFIIIQISHSASPATYNQST